MKLFVVLIQSLSCVWPSVTPWTAAHQVPLSFTVSWSFLKLMSIELVMLFNHLILCHPLLLFSSILPSIRVFSNESDLPIRWPKYGSLSVSPFNEYPGLISVRINWFPCYPRALKNLFQHNSKRWILQCSTFFMVQLSHPYMATGKTIALIIWTSVGKVMSLLFNTLSRFVI